MLYQIIENIETPLFLLALIIAFLSSILISLPAHEFAHAHAAYREGDPTAKYMGRYTLAPFAHIDWQGLIFLLLFSIGYAKPVPVDSRNFKRGKKSALRVACAGVLTNLAIGIFTCFIYVMLQKVWPALFTDYGFFSVLYLLFFEYMISLNFMLFFFNLLPIYPLDGFRVVETFSKTENGYIRFMKRYSFWIILALLLFDVLNLYIGYFGNGLYNLFTWLFGKMFGLV